MKRLFALMLALLLCVSVFAGCEKEAPAATTNQDGTQTDEPQKEETPAVEDDGIMKILMIGHSLGNDSSFMLPAVFQAENMTNVVIGVIYHSGCRLGQHAEYIKQEAAQYAYYEFDLSSDEEWRRADSTGGYHSFIPGTGTDVYIEDGSIAQTMKFGITRHDWDLVVMQAGVFEAANIGEGYSMDFKANIETIQNHVLENDIEPGSVPKFAWNITWTCPSDGMMNDSYKNGLYNNFKDQREMYETIISTFQDTVQPLHDWEYVFPSGTAVENAVTSKLKAEGVYRDFIHVNDFGRLMVAYTWYCTMFDKDINELEIKPIDYHLVNDAFARQYKKNLELTEEQQNILKESVSNALKNPYQATDSQYTA